MKIGRIILIILGILLALRAILIIVAAINHPDVASKLMGSATFFILVSIVCFWLSGKFGRKD
jgi:hypothetical protein